MDLMTQFARKGSSTLADVITLIRNDSSLSRSKQERLVNDVETACRWFSMKPGEVIAHPMSIRPRFGRLSPGGLGVTEKRIGNVRSSLKFALQRVDLVDGRSFKVPMTEEWRALLRRIPNRYHSTKVHCIASYASARNVAACAVDDEFSARLLEALLADRLHGNPRVVHQNAVRAWNYLVDTVPGWPATKLEMPRYRKTTPVKDLLNTDLVADIERFLIRNSTDDPFNLDLPMDPWKPSTVATYRRYLLRYIGLLISLGDKSNDLRRLRDLVGPDRVVAALKLMRAQNDGKARVGASHIARLLSQVAGYAVHIAEVEGLSVEEVQRFTAIAETLSKLADRLHRRNKVLSQKYRARLAPLREERNLAKLFLLPFAIAKKLAALNQPTRGQALQMQWALALTILTFCPLRISTLCNLRIDRHLVWSGPAMGGELRLNFAEGELKSGTAEVLPLPPECARLVREYIKSARLVLASGNSPYLFPGRSESKGKLRTVMSGQLATLIYKHTGFEVTPHLYRHVVHLVVLTRFPGAYAMISRVLTHRSLETAKKNYAYFDVELSTRAYHDLIRDVQQGRSIKASATEVAYDIDKEAMEDVE